ncbi:MAG: CTP-dependent riboflavin kinase [Candidatus Marsarchaeota archaeon]|jgi:riboflavin kinase|nr:CTP-dependent riboflavin kinase [Candidatus Marsarchaeota archaeon]
MQKIKGTVVSGNKEGAYYVMLDGYKIQFKDKLGITPYPGTLNIKLNSSEIKKLNNIDDSKSIAINGFEHNGKILGDVLSYKVSFYGNKCAALMPNRSSHKEEIELISGICLRDSLHLTDGQIVEVDFL